MEKLRILANIIFSLLMLFILGSCVAEINDISGINKAQKMVGIFFLNLFLLVCLIILFAIILTRIEKYSLGKEKVDKANSDHGK